MAPALDLDDQHDGTSQSTASSSQKAAHGHRRSLSGNLLSRLNFLKSSVSDDKVEHAQVSDVEASGSAKDGGATSPKTAISSLQDSLNGRRRKPSLRKTALLGTGRLKPDTRDRKSLPSQPSVSMKEANIATADSTSLAQNTDDGASTQIRRSFSYEEIDTVSTEDNLWSANRTESRPQDLVVDTKIVTQQDATKATPPQLFPSTSPSITSPASASQSYASTTDDDDVLSFSRPANGLLVHQPHKPTLSVNPTSYYTSSGTITRRRSNKQSLSPLAAIPLDALSPTPEAVDYSDTEWWGWVVLIVTWVAFVVGMGSCFGIWSWAWDVGQTPYAPPELEDDPTLPIVGYYPALLTLATVMAWVWVVVAWVGMKYFKHAKIQGDDS